jgi:hypothetical protein
MDDTYIQARIDSFESKITLYESALEALAGGAHSYTINTGQTVQTVSKANLEAVRKTLDWLYEQLEYWTGRLSTNPSGSIVVRPYT